MGAMEVMTKAQCEARISGVCPGCGGPVTAIETVDNSDRPTFWSGCEVCSIFTEGYPPEIHRLARTLVEEGTLVPYRHIDRDGSPEMEAYWLHCQTRGAADIVRRIYALSDRLLPKPSEVREEWRVAGYNKAGAYVATLGGYDSAESAIEEARCPEWLRLGYHARAESQTVSTYPDGSQFIGAWGEVGDE